MGTCLRHLGRSSLLFPPIYIMFPISSPGCYVMWWLIHGKSLVLSFRSAFPNRGVVTGHDPVQKTAIRLSHVKEPHGLCRWRYGGIAVRRHLRTEQTREKLETARDPNYVPISFLGRGPFVFLLLRWLFPPDLLVLEASAI